MIERRIHILTDEEISYILTGLRLLSNKYVTEDNTDGSIETDRLYNKIDDCFELGVINNEKIKYGNEE